jgi:hypothetical protein
MYQEIKSKIDNDQVLDVYEYMLVMSMAPEQFTEEQRSIVYERSRDQDDT